MDCLLPSTRSIYSQVHATSTSVLAIPDTTVHLICGVANLFGPRKKMSVAEELSNEISAATRVRKRLLGESPSSVKLPFEQQMEELLTKTARQKNLGR